MVQKENEVALNMTTPWTKRYVLDDFKKGSPASPSATYPETFREHLSVQEHRQIISDLNLSIERNLPGVGSWVAPTKIFLCILLAPCFLFDAHMLTSFFEFDWRVGGALVFSQLIVLSLLFGLDRYANQKFESGYLVVLNDLNGAVNRTFPRKKILYRIEKEQLKYCLVIEVDIEMTSRVATLMIDDWSPAS